MPPDNVTPDEFSPIAKCLIIARARGRAIRLARERAGTIAAEDSTDDESTFAAVMREAASDRGDDEQVRADPALA
jgi:hypothetical protein